MGDLGEKLLDSRKVLHRLLIVKDFGHVNSTEVCCCTESIGVALPGDLMNAF